MINGKAYQNQLMTLNSRAICLLLFLSAFLVSCNGQVQKHDEEDKKTNPNSFWVDPLFFIEGQLAAWIRNIYQDRSGNLWFATNHYGIMRYSNDTLVYFDEEDGVGGGRVTGIVEDAYGKVWFGTYYGLTRFDPQHPASGISAFVNYPNATKRSPNDIWSVIIDTKGNIWLGTLKGVVQFDGESFTSFPLPKARVSDTTTILSYDRISCILEDKNGILWFGTDGFGICRYDPAADAAGQEPFSHLTTEDGLCDNNVADLLEDSEGNIWIGTMFGGLCRYKGSPASDQGSRFTNFTRDVVIEGDEVYGLYEDKLGRIWFAAENQGVYHYDPWKKHSGKDAFTKFNEADGLKTGGIICFYEDREGRFWLGGWGGLFRYVSSPNQSEGGSFISVTKEGPWK